MRMCMVLIDRKDLAIEKVDTKKQRADVFTKRLAPKEFIAARALLSIIDPVLLGPEICSALERSKKSRIKKSPSATPVT